MTAEHVLLERIAERSRSLAQQFPGLITIGPGDDCAALTLPRDAPILLTVDQLVEGRHYRAGTSIDLIARKAVARSISDIAAMAGRPLAALAAGVLPHDFADDDALCAALAKWGLHWSCPLTGGDIARSEGPAVLSITILGAAHPTRGPVRRTGARPGDGVYVTGAVGGSLDSGRHLTFEPRLREAHWLATVLGDRLHAMIDLSDGLGRDASRIAGASAVRIEIDASSIPVHAGVAGWRSAADDGEDYELLFTASSPPPACCPETGTLITRIGEVVAGRGCVARDGAAEIDLSSLGWDHA